MKVKSFIANRRDPGRRQEIIFTFISSTICLLTPVKRETIPVVIKAPKTVCFLFYLIFFVHCAIAQNATLSGTISDSVTAETLAGVTIGLNNGNGTVSNDAGQYALQCNPGTYTVRFSYIGYENQQQELTLVAGQNKMVDIKLVPLPAELSLIVVTASKYEK